jgi:hypothetical protein
MQNLDEKKIIENSYLEDKGHGKRIYYHGHLD